MLINETWTHHKIGQNWSRFAQSKIGKMACKPKISSKLQMKFKFLSGVLFLRASSWIFVIKGWYCSITHFINQTILFWCFSTICFLSIWAHYYLWNSRFLKASKRKTHRKLEGRPLSEWPNLTLINSTQPSWFNEENNIFPLKME